MYLLTSTMADYLAFFFFECNRTHLGMARVFFKSNFASEKKIFPIGDFSTFQVLEM